MPGGKNVLGGELAECCSSPVTGFYRNGLCETGPGDMGVHVVCARMTRQFLQFSKSRGNDLSTPNPDIDFPGLQAGDCWCLCAARWQEAHEAGMAPEVRLASTHMSALEFCSLDDLIAKAIDAPVA